MLYFKYLILLICAVSLSYTVVRTLRISHAIGLLQTLSHEKAGCCFSLGFVGCSVICRHIRHLDDIKALLSSEYDRYEIILIMDANLQPELFYNIVKQFKMLRVTPPDSSALAHSPIRLLYRSRQRCYQRLILLDKGATTPYDDLNAAATIASFDYLLPLNTNFTLRHQTMEHIAMILASHNDAEPRIDLIRSTADNSLIFRHIAIIEAGGFSPQVIRKIPRKNILEVHIPLLRHTAHNRPQDLLTLASNTCFAILVTLLIAGTTTALAPTATLLAAGCSAHYLTELFDNKCSLRAIIYQISHIRPFFYARKFVL